MSTTTTTTTTSTSTPTAVLDALSRGQHVALLIGNPNYPPNAEYAAQIKAKIQNGLIYVSTQQDSTLSSMASSSLDVVISCASSHTDHTLPLFFEIYRVLRGDALFVCQEPLQDRTFEISEKLKQNLTISGFVDTKISMNGSFVEVISKKPEWETGTAQPIKLNKKVKVEKKEKPVIWTNKEEDEIMDETDLLDESDRVKPDMVSIRAQFDCGTSKSGGKACKNCTCGRAELEAAAAAAATQGGGVVEVAKKKLTLQMLENPGVESSCGSCGLGDAFRCAGCPYRGLPAFKPGQKITLPDDFFVDV